jgi:ribosomal protein S18 acetylase RimI-like enzyme
MAGAVLRAFLDRSCAEPAFLVLEVDPDQAIALAAGNGFGKGLIRAFLAEARSMDAHCVYLTTDAEGNDAGNAFYRNAGFQHTRRFLQREGRWMNEYVISSFEGQ